MRENDNVLRKQLRQQIDCVSRFTNVNNTLVQRIYEIESILKQVDCELSITILDSAELDLGSSDDENENENDKKEREKNKDSNVDNKKNNNDDITNKKNNDDINNKRNSFINSEDTIIYLNDDDLESDCEDNGNEITFGNKEQPLQLPQPPQFQQQPLQPKQPTQQEQEQAMMEDYINKVDKQKDEKDMQTALNIKIMITTLCEYLNKNQKRNKTN